MTPIEMVRLVGDATFFALYTIRGFQLENMDETTAREYAQAVALFAENEFRKRFVQEED